MAAAQETVMRFHQKCHRGVTLSDNNTTAAAGGWAGTVFSSVPQLHNNRFVFKINKRVRKSFSFLMLKFQFRYNIVYFTLSLCFYTSIYLLHTGAQFSSHHVYRSNTIRSW